MYWKTWLINVELPIAYAGKTCGLCGNFDGNRGNERIGRDGNMIGSWNAFGDDWVELQFGDEENPW